MPWEDRLGNDCAWYAKPFDEDGTVQTPNDDDDDGQLIDYDDDYFNTRCSFWGDGYTNNGGYTAQTAWYVRMILYY